VPGWLHDGAASIRINGAVAEGRSLLVGDSTAKDAPSPASRLLQPEPPRPGSYFEITRTWQPDDVIEFTMSFEPTLWEANPLVEETIGQLAVKCGPLVYCVESKDLPAGVRLEDVALSRAAAPRREQIGNTSVVAFVTPAAALPQPRWKPGELYRESPRPAAREFELQLVPYYAWGNRGEADMSVWLPAR
jgi:DUF1680 family protein